MNNLKVILLAMILLSTGSFFNQVEAQQKSKEEQEKELQILKAIEEQKKAMTEQKKAQYDLQFDLSEQDAAMQDVMKDIRVEVESDWKKGDGIKIISPRGSRSFSINEPFVFTPGADTFFNYSFDGDSERTTWEFSKSVKDKSFSKEYSFDVEKSVNTVVMSVMGDCKSGDIRVKIIMPSGKSYSDILIDEFGNLNWRKSFTISETENQDKTGEWIFEIESNKATGYFKINLQAY